MSGEPVQLRFNDPWSERPWSNSKKTGRLDVDGNEWWACDPYPTWYRWEDGQLVTTEPAAWSEERTDA